MDQFVEKEAVRILPNDPNAECSVLSAMVMNEEALLKASETLKVEDFYRKENGIIFKAILELNQSNIPVDLEHVIEIPCRDIGHGEQGFPLCQIRTIIGQEFAQGGAGSTFPRVLVNDDNDFSSLAAHVGQQFLPVGVVAAARNQGSHTEDHGDFSKRFHKRII